MGRITAWQKRKKMFVETSLLYLHELYTAWQVMFTGAIRQVYISESLVCVIVDAKM